MVPAEHTMATSAAVTRFWDAFVPASITVAEVVEEAVIVDDVLWILLHFYFIQIETPIPQSILCFLGF